MVWKNTGLYLAVQFTSVFDHNYKEAKKLLQKALLIRKLHYQDPMNIRLSPTLYFLGQAEYGLGNHMEAKRLLHRSLKIEESYYQDPMHVRMANTLHNLSLIAEELGDYSDALKYLNKSYTIWNKHYKNRLHEVMNNAYTFPRDWPKFSHKNVDGAIIYYKKRLAITKKLFGDKHYFVAGYYYILGQLYEIKGKPEIAIKQFMFSLNIAKDSGKTIKNSYKQDEFRKNIVLVEKAVARLNQKISL